MDPDIVHYSKKIFEKEIRNVAYARRLRPTSRCRLRSVFPRTKKTPASMEFLLRLRGSIPLGVRHPTSEDDIFLGLERPLLSSRRSILFYKIRKILSYGDRWSFPIEMRVSMRTVYAGSQKSSSAFIENGYDRSQCSRWNGRHRNGSLPDFERKFRLQWNNPSGTSTTSQTFFAP